MANVGVVAMIAALRAEQPGIGMAKLTSQIKERLPSTIEMIKKQQIRDICQQLDAASSTPECGTNVATLQNDHCQGAYTSFRDAERHGYLSLDPDTLLSFNGGDASKPHWAPAANLRHHFEIFLTLAGLKPCTLILGSYISPVCPIAVNGIVIDGLAPIISRLDLGAYGFELHYIAADVLTSQVAHRGFKGGWVFADTRSEQWPLVRDIFLGPSGTPPRRTPEDTIGRALGYPVRSMGADAVTFIDLTETEVMQKMFGADVPPVIGIEFCTIPGDAADMKRIVEYYVACVQAAKEVDINLDIDLSRHAGLARFFEILRKGDVLQKFRQIMRR
ncbi:hypothetical protein F4778DRAFT_785427 [Xylariomycetidae sp. FL2044]|nr:hypothetical protein F4778DRAFT_785427 [Xylariomycetidae sp. FL2044]